MDLLKLANKKKTLKGIYLSSLPIQTKRQHWFISAHHLCHKSCIHFLISSIIIIPIMNHRKLFPALAAEKQSTDCQNHLCDPVFCAYICIPNSPPYPLPRPPPPPPLETGLTTSSIFVIIVISALVISFLLFCYYSIVAKRRDDMQPPAEAANAEQADEGLDQNRVDHPIWFIATTGLQQSVINSITVFKYKKGEGLVEGTSCSVCLSEFQEDERLRLLPNCDHAFHISCIDTWLTTHTNCPLCRAPIVRDDPVTSPPPPLPAVSWNPDSLESISRTQMENSESNGDGLSNNHGERNEDCGNWGETEEVTGKKQKNHLSMDSETAGALCFGLRIIGSPSI